MLGTVSEPELSYISGHFQYGRGLERKRGNLALDDHVLLKRPRSEPKDLDWKAVLCGKFFAAAESGDLKTLTAVLANQLFSDPNVRNNRGQTALHIACENGNVQFAQQLLHDNRIDVTLTDHLGYNAFLRAAIKGHVDIVQCFVHDTRDHVVAMVAKHGSMALLYAAQGAHYHVIDCLLADHRIDPNFNDVSTPLIWVTRNECRSCVELLLADNRVDPNIIDNNGVSAIHFAAGIEDDGCMLEIFLAAPRVNVNLPSISGFSVLLHAAREGRTKVVERLVANGRTVLPPAVVESLNRKNFTRERSCNFLGVNDGTGERVPCGKSTGDAMINVSLSNGDGSSPIDIRPNPANNIEPEKPENQAFRIIATAVKNVRRKRRARFIGIAMAALRLRARARAVREAFLKSDTTRLVTSTSLTALNRTGTSDWSSRDRKKAKDGARLRKSGSAAMLRIERSLPETWCWTSLGGLRDFSVIS